MVQVSKTILATRGSALALWQARFVAEQLTRKGLDVELNIIKTTGDAVQDRFLHEIGGKGLFIKELEEAMQAGKAHLAVHSLKDLPAVIPSGFTLAAVLPRHAVSDVIIFKQSVYERLNLEVGSIVTAKVLAGLGPMRVATSSLRRRALLERLGSGISVMPVRGNVDTRLRKLEEQDWHALILAEASLDRLSINGVARHRLEPEWFVPCAGQGALAIETPEHSPILEVIRSLQCPASRLQIDVERRVLATLGGDCTMPFGCLVQDDRESGDGVTARAIVLDMQGKAATAVVRLKREAVGDGTSLVTELLDGLRATNVNQVLATLDIPHRV